VKDIRLKEILQLYTKEDLWNYNQEKLEQLAMRDHEIEILKNTQTQKAIECLEDVKKYACLHICFTSLKAQNDFYDYIDQKISELKGE
jgi:hypothetical protein